MSRPRAERTSAVFESIESLRFEATTFLRQLRFERRAGDFGLAELDSL